MQRPQPSRRKKIEAQAPLDEELFATPVHQPEYGDIFASLLDLASEATTPAFDDPLDEPRRAPLRMPHPRFSHVQKGLLAGIVFVAALVVYGVLRFVPSQPRPDELSQNQMTSFQPSYTDSPGQPPLQSPQTSVPMPEPAPAFERTQVTLPPVEPLSLQIADRLYLAADYENALAAYDRLHRRLPPTEAQQPLRDFLLLRMALCNRNVGDIQQADNMLRTVSLSRLPVLRALARYHQSTTLMQRERFLEAATRAYQTIALVEVVDYDEAWLGAVRRQCSFVAAEALTRSLLSLRDADGDLPPELWTPHPDIDPFTNLGEAQLKVFLTSGGDKLDEALLAPQIRPASEPGHWTVICNGAPIEELLSRFATNTGYNIEWLEDGRGGIEEESLRRRPVYLYLRSASAQQVMTIAAGSVGLLARMDTGQSVGIVDPSVYVSLADHTERLAEESVSLWQRFLLTADDDKRIPSSHFALGLLHAVRERTDEAIAEYRLIANRFPKDVLAPHALLHSGRLKVTLRDYAGAQADLQQLVNLYPETELADRACLYLADATMKAGLYEEATNLYRRVYNLGLSHDSQIESSLGAGRGYYETGQYEEAATWLGRYIALARDGNRREFPAACLLLGKTYLALERPQQAHAALNLALQGDLSRQQHVETITTLVRTYRQQELYVEALNILEGANAWQLSQQEAVELLLIRAQILRSIGLQDKAVAILEAKSQFLPNSNLKGKVALELAACYVEGNELERARKTLSDALALVDPGALAQQIGCELARICLRLGQPEQAISVCSQLLQHATHPAERQAVRSLLASAYREKGQYERAVSVLLEDRATSTLSGPTERN
jgi:tetratricopeptide (TPR) repeat protein